MLQRLELRHTELRARLRPALARQVGQAMLAPLLTVAFAFPGAGLAASSPAPATPAHAAPFNLAEREQRLTRTLAAIGDLRSALDRTEFDTEALLESLDYDPQAIIDFVRNEIRFEPYEGLLRGVQGTLMSRAGNTLDQSLLLAYLLGEAGADARLAHGRLSQEHALLLVQSLRGQAAPASMNKLPDLSAPLQKIIQASAVDAGAADTALQFIADVRPPQELPIWAAADTGRDYLLTHLGKADIALEPVDAEARLAEQSLSYFWVEFKDGANDPWQRVHTLAAADRFDEHAVPTLERLTDSIPEHFQHRLRITAKLARQAAGKTEVIELMQPWERPVANLLGKRLSFANQPNGLDSLHDLQDLNQIEARTTLLIPTLNDAPAPGAQAFDLRGRTVALSNLQMDSLGAAGFFQTAGDKTLDAADMLAGLTSGKSKEEPLTPAYSLRRVWLEYVSIHPNGAERVDERTIWQAPAAMTPAAGAAIWELATPHGIGVATSTYPAGYLLDLELARLQAIEPALRWVLAAHGTPAGQPLPPTPEIDPAWSGFPELSYLSQFDAGIDPDAESLLAYRAEPSIVVTRHGLRNAQGEPRGFADVDIVHNRRTVLRTDAAGIQTDPLQALRLGAWDTLVEQVELESRLPALLAVAPTTVISANRMYQDPQQRSQAPLIVDRLEALAALPKETLAESSRPALEEDLQRGYVVAMEAPARPHSLVWWRVDPATGEALGRGMDGRGQTLVEGLNILTLVSAKTSMVVGTTLCTASKNSCSFADCLGYAAVNTGIGMGLGGALGGAFGAAAGGLLAAVVDRVGMGWNPLPVCYN